MVKKWRVSWLIGNRFQYRYYDTDYAALLKHIENLHRYGIMGGARLHFRAAFYGDPSGGVNYLPVGGCDFLLGLTYRLTFLGRSKESWEDLITKARAEGKEMEFYKRRQM